MTAKSRETDQIAAVFAEMGHVPFPGPTAAGRASDIMSKTGDIDPAAAARGRRSRRRGQAGEREAARVIEECTGWRVTRRCRQHAGDSDLEGIPGWSIECKHAATLAVPAWWRQTCEQAARANALPLLVFRVPRRGWRFIWPVSALLGVPGTWNDLTMTVESSVEAWASVARELAAVWAGIGPRSDDPDAGGIRVPATVEEAL